MLCAIERKKQHDVLEIDRLGGERGPRRECLSPSERWEGASHVNSGGV